MALAEGAIHYFLDRFLTSQRWTRTSHPNFANVGSLEPELETEHRSSCILRALLVA